MFVYFLALFFIALSCCGVVYAFVFLCDLLFTKQKTLRESITKMGRIIFVPVVGEPLYNKFNQKQLPDKLALLDYGYSDYYVDRCEPKEDIDLTKWMEKYKQKMSGEMIRATKTASNDFRESDTLFIVNKSKISRLEVEKKIVEVEKNNYIKEEKNEEIENIKSRLDNIEDDFENLKVTLNHNDIEAI